MTTEHEFIERCNSTIEDAEAVACITRDISLQEEALEALESLSRVVAEEKARAIEAENERWANLLLGYECAIDVVKSELRMWMLLKSSHPNDAWDQLVIAQTAALAAVRADAGFAHAALIYKRLEAIEHLVFPPQVFISSGFIVGRQECSICGMEYGDCDHLKGEPYMGRFCQIVMRDLTADHVAIVKHPRDKRCRVTQFSVPGGNRDRMTWKTTPSAKPVKDGQMTASVRFV